MPVTLPEKPRFINDWEEKVWRALDEQLGPDDLIVVGQRVTDHKKDHEIDFVVAMEGAGIICVEVKGGNVWHDGNTLAAEHRQRTEARSTRSSRRGKAATRCAPSSKVINAGINPGCAGIMRSSFRAREICHRTSRCRTVRGGR